MQEEFLKEKVRGDFWVTRERKKIGAAELNLLKQFDKVCRENGVNNVENNCTFSWRIGYNKCVF